MISATLKLLLVIAMFSAVSIGPQQFSRQLAWRPAKRRPNGANAWILLLHDSVADAPGIDLPCCDSL